MPTTLYPDKPCIECGKPSLGRNLCTTHYNAVWRAENAERYTHTCVQCGEEFKTWRKTMASCSLLCQRRSAIKTAQARAVAATRKGTDIVPYVPAPSAPSSRVWVAGRCTQCGEAFVAASNSAKYCSPRCSVNASWHRRYTRRGQFTVTTAKRKAIYARDEYICQLCKEPVNLDLHPQHAWAATLDHIEPQSLAVTPDHSESNLRLAHRMCNSIRGNRVDITFQ